MQTPILIIEDEVSIAETLLYALSRDGFAVFHALDGNAALSILETQLFSAIVLDVGLPDINGFDLCKRIRERSNTPILFLTARNEEIDRIIGLELGADDYIGKPFSPREVVARVKAVIRRTEQKAIASDEGLSIWKHDKDKAQIVYRERVIPLSRYEYKLLTVLLGRPGRIFSRAELMDRAWEDPDMSMERTVDTHIKTIRSKIHELFPDSDPIVTHRGFGYALKEES